MPPDTVYVGRPTQWGNPFTGPDAVALFTQRMEANRAANPELFETVFRNAEAGVYSVRR